MWPEAQTSGVNSSERHTSCFMEANLYLMCLSPVVSVIYFFLRVPPLYGCHTRGTFSPTLLVFFLNGLFQTAISLHGINNVSFSSIQFSSYQLSSIQLSSYNFSSAVDVFRESYNGKFDHKIVRTTSTQKGTSYIHIFSAKWLENHNKSCFGDSIKKTKTK